jgi:transcriptional regulator with XRE-family HTH domain
MGRRGWSQRDLARRAKVSDAAISDVISGRRNLGLDLARALAEPLNMEVEDILREAGLLSRKKEAKRDAWARRIENKLAKIKDERDREIIERTIDILSPDARPKKAGGSVRNEGSS